MPFTVFWFETKNKKRIYFRFLIRFYSSTIFQTGYIFVKIIGKNRAVIMLTFAFHTDLGEVIVVRLAMVIEKAQSANSRLTGTQFLCIRSNSVSCPIVVWGDWWYTRESVQKRIKQAVTFFARSDQL